MYGCTWLLSWMVVWSWSWVANAHIFSWTCQICIHACDGCASIYSNCRFHNYMHVRLWLLWVFVSYPLIVWIPYTNWLPLHLFWANPISFGSLLCIRINQLFLINFKRKVFSFLKVCLILHVFFLFHLKRSEWPVMMKN